MANCSQQAVSDSHRSYLHYSSLTSSEVDIPIQPPSLSSLEMHYLSERKTWASVFKSISLGLLVMSVLGMGSIPLIPAGDAQWVTWSACTALSLLTCLAGGLGLRAVHTCSSPPARLLMHYLICFSAVSISAGTFLLIYYLKYNVLVPTSTWRSYREGVVLRLLLLTLGFVLVWLGVCGVLLYCAYRLLRTTERWEWVRRSSQVQLATRHVRESID